MILIFMIEFLGSNFLYDLVSPLRFFMVCVKGVNSLLDGPSSMAELKPLELTSLTRVTTRKKS